MKNSPTFFLKNRFYEIITKYFNNINLYNYPPPSKCAMTIPVLKISEKVNILYCKYRTTTMHPNLGGYTSEYQTHNIDLHFISDLSDSKLHVHMSIFTPYVSTLKTSQLLCTVPVHT